MHTHIENLRGLASGYKLRNDVGPTDESTHQVLRRRVHDHLLQAQRESPTGSRII